MAVETQFSLSPRNNIGVLIHGCHLKAEKWEQIVLVKATI